MSSYCVFSGALVALALVLTPPPAREPGDVHPWKLGGAPPLDRVRLDRACAHPAGTRRGDAHRPRSQTTLGVGSCSIASGSDGEVDRRSALRDVPVVRRRPTEAEQRFLSSASDLRARFKKETRGARAVGAAPAMPRAAPTEGEGLVVVSVVCAFDRHLFSLPRNVDASPYSTCFLPRRRQSRRRDRGRLVARRRARSLVLGGARAVLFQSCCASTRRRRCRPARVYVLQRHLPRRDPDLPRVRRTGAADPRRA